MLVLNDLKKGKDKIREKEKPDAYDNLEKEKAREEIENLKSDRKLREKYADRILRYLEIYSIIVAGFIILSGFDFIPFNIHPNTLLTLVGSTAVAAIGLVGFIAKGLFGNK